MKPEKPKIKKHSKKKLIFLIFIGLITMAIVLDHPELINNVKELEPSVDGEVLEYLIPGEPINPESLGKGWHIISSTGNENNFTLDINNLKDKKVDICFYLKEGIEEIDVDLTDKYLYNDDNERIKDNKNKDIKLKWESNKCLNGTKNGYHISLTNVQAVNIDDYIQLGNNSIVIYYVNVIEVEWLNSSRGFIEDIYLDVWQQDNNWTEPIPENDYIRVVFERIIDHSGDITLYAKSNGTTDIEVYLKDSNDLIETLHNITTEGFYKTELINLTGSNDTFDLKIIGDSIEIDLITDPPIEIDTCAELQAISGDGTADYILIDDVDCLGYGFNPLFQVGAFTGTFNGSGYTISHLEFSTGTAESGLFGDCNSPAIITNFNLENISYTTTNGDLGGVCGDAQSGTTYSNINVNGIINTDSGTAGGIIGICAGCDIYNVSVDISFTGTGSNADANGMIVGSLSSSGTLENCTATGNISGSGEIGGILGSTSASVISDCISYANVTCSGTECGGAIGDTGSSVLTNVHAYGNVTSSASFVGGFCGTCKTGTTINSSAHGNIRGTTDNGGFAGSISGTVDSCFSTGNVHGIDGGAGGDTAGFSGNVAGTGFINNSYSSGNVSLGNVGGHIGGFIGETASGYNVQNSYSKGNTVNEAGTGDTGGFVGEASSGGSINNIFATGDVSGTTKIGGIAGDNDGTTFTNNYWNNHSGNPDISSGQGSSSGTGITDDESYFYDISNEPLASWDFDNVWCDLNDDIAYPTLIWEGCVAPPADSAPVSILSFPADNDNFTAGTKVSFEINATDDSNLVNVTLFIWNPDDSLNHTNTTTWSGTTNSTIFVRNLTADGLYLWNGYVCDNATVTQCDWDVNRTLNISTPPPLDTTKPYFTYIPPTTEITYGSSVGVDFNATDETAFKGYYDNSTKFSINSSGYLINSTTLRAGQYLINITINDTSDNINSTIYNVTINKVVTSLGITGTTPITYETSTDVAGTNCPAQITCNLDKSNIVYEAGTETFNYSTAGNENYTQDSITKDIVINQNTTVLGISGTTPIIYGTVTDVAGSGCPTQLSCSLDKGNAVYGVGTETFNYSTTGNNNYTADSITKDIIINQANLTAVLTNNTVLTRTYDGSLTTIGLSESNTGDGDVIYKIYKDNVDKGTSDIEGGTGTYVYVLNTTGGTNYTSNSSLDTLTLTINQATGVIYSWINNARDNFTAYNNTVNGYNNLPVNATLNTGSGTIELWLNGTRINDGTSPLNNITNVNAGVQNVTAIYSGNNNYTSDSEVWWINITLTVAPPVLTPEIGIDILYPTTNINVTQNQFFNVSINVTCINNTCSTINVTLDPESVNYYLDFDGLEESPVSGFINVTDPRFDFDSYDEKFAVSFWAKTSDITNGGSTYIDTYPNIFNHGFQIHSNSGASELVFEKGTSGGKCEQGNYTVDLTGDWKYITVQSNGTFLEMYLNGILVFLNSTYTDDCALNWHSNGEFRMGDGLSAEALNGSIDELRVYNRTLTQSEINQIYSSGRIQSDTLITNDLLLYLPLNETTGNDSYGLNYSGNWELFSDSLDNPVWSNETITYKGIIPTSDDVPFWTNATTNPLTTSSLSEGQSEVITFWVNATGNLYTTWEFFAYINTTDNLTISNISNKWNVTIRPSVNPEINLDVLYPLGNISVAKDQWFNITVNVTCLLENCGDINVSLDPQEGYNILTKDPEEDVSIIVEFKSEPLTKDKKKFSFNTQESKIANEHNSISKYGKPKKEFKHLMNAVVLDVKRKEIKDIEKLPNVKKVWEDKIVQMAIDETIPLINADNVWNYQNASSSNLTGNGIIIAVIDTGIAYNHSDFESNCQSAVFTSGNCNKTIYGWDFTNDDNDPYDDNGHGTHVAGIIGANGTMKGVAPNSVFLAYKVLNQNGVGSTSNVISAIENATLSGADIISLSLGARYGYADNAINTVIENAVNNGTVVVTASGNEGSSLYTLRDLGSELNAITVGSIDKTDIIAPSSSRGYSRYSNGSIAGIKPDVLSYGVSIESTVPNGTCTFCSDSGYRSLSGTSMATPHVSGTIALLKQAHPSWSVEQLRSAIANPAISLGYDLRIQGSGKVDALKSYNISGIVSPNNIFLGEHKNLSIVSWNSTKQLNLSNPTAGTLSYNLSINFDKPGIIVNLSKDNITLATNLSSTFNINMFINTTLAPSGALFGQIIINSSDNQNLIVPFSVYTELTNKGLISTVTGDKPFYTNESNPRTINLNQDQSEKVVFWVNPTGDVNNTYKFFAYANTTSDLSINNITDDWYITIASDIIYPQFSNLVDNNGTLTTSGNATFNVTLINTNTTVGLEFNGTNYTATSNNWINLRDNLYSSVQITISEQEYRGEDIAMSIWFNTSYDNWTKPEPLFDVANGAQLDIIDYNKYFCLVRNLSMELGGTRYNITATTGSNLNDSQWHNVVCNWNNTAGNLSIWSDGNIINSSTFTPLTISVLVASSTYLGFSSDGNFDGDIDDARLYYFLTDAKKYSLNNSEILEINNSGRSYDGNLSSHYKLVSWYKMDEGANRLVKDSADLLGQGSFEDALIHNNAQWGTVQNYSVVIPVTNAGIYPYYWWAYGNGSENLFNRTITYNYTVLESADNTPPYFTYIPPTTDITYGTSVGVDFNATDETAFDSYSDNSTKFSINGSGYLINTSALSAGQYLINITINDSSNNLNSTIYNVTINQATGVIYAWINNSRSNFTSLNNTVTGYNNLRLNGTLQTGSGDIELWLNGTRINDGSSPLTNLSNVDEGIQNVTAIYSGNNNYTSDTETWWINITLTVPVIDTTPPVITNPRNFTHTVNTSFNQNMAATDDVGISFYWLNDTTVFNISQSGQITNVSLVNQIKIHWLNYSVNDTSNNLKSLIFYINVTEAGEPAAVVAAEVCRYKKFGYYNLKLPAMWEEACL